MSAGWIYVAMLAWAQTGDQARDQFAGQTSVTETAAIFSSNFSSETSSVPEAFYPAFVLPQPTAPPPLPALAAEALPLPATRVTTTWLAPGGGHGFGMTDADCNHTLLFGYEDLPPLSITPGLGLHLWSGPLKLDLPARVYDAYVDFNWQPIDKDRWGLSLGITPGWYGDFVRLDGHSFQLTGWVLGNLRIGPQWTVVGGLAYVRQLQSHLLPVGGLVWTPSDDTRLELVIPKPRLVRRYWADENGSAFWYLAGQLGGGAWAVADTSTANVLVGYSDLRALVGIESFHASGRGWNLEAGYVFARHLTIDGNDSHSPSDTVVVQASVAF